jgi:hypothetical protein
VVVYNESLPPYFLEDGLKIQPGFENNLLLKKTEYYELDSAYRNCIKDLTYRGLIWVNRTIYMLGKYVLKTGVSICKKSYCMFIEH